MFLHAVQLQRLDCRMLVEVHVVYLLDCPALLRYVAQTRPGQAGPQSSAAGRSCCGFQTQQHRAWPAVSVMPPPTGQPQQHLDHNLVLDWL